MHDLMDRTNIGSWHSWFKFKDKAMLMLISFMKRREMDIYFSYLVLELK
jgi:hypothetical protein